MGDALIFLFKKRIAIPRYCCTALESKLNWYSLFAAFITIISVSPLWICVQGGTGQWRTPLSATMSRFQKHAYTDNVHILGLGQKNKKGTSSHVVERYDAFMVKRFQTLIMVKIVLLCDSDFKYNYYTSAIKTYMELFTNQRHVEANSSVCSPCSERRSCCSSILSQKLVSPLPANMGSGVISVTLAVSQESNPRSRQRAS